MQPTARPLAQMGEDEQHSATELIEVLHHTNAVRAASDYRMLQAASLIHEEREQDHLVRLAAVLGEESTSLADLERLAARAAAGEDPRAQYGPNGLEQAVAEVGAALTIPPARAREFIEAGSVLRHQLPFTGATLGAGRIDLPRFLAIVRRTSLCTPENLDLLDKLIAEAIETREPMSMTRFLAMIDKLIAKIDPAATRRRREVVDNDRNISVRPDRHTPGQARIGGALPAEQAAAVDARLNAMAASVHNADPRTAAQRRADALVTLANGSTTLACRCEACSAEDDEIEAIAAETEAPETEAPKTDPAEQDGTATSDPVATRPTFHIVVNLSTLLGHDDDLAFLDGQGVLDADTARALVAEAQRCYVNPDSANTAQVDRYAPSKKDAVRFSSPDQDLHLRVARLSGSSRRGVLPIAYRAHLLGNAFTGRDLFGSLTRETRPPDDPARQRIDTIRTQRGAAVKCADKRAMDRWNEQNPPPF